ncbi:alcohol-forming fatty acyl-CoA reductase [Trifolium repens]|nr:alcohol-forming fatty acyl-CoA reductase [Trifolium repens]
MNWLPRRVMSAWRIAGIIHALERWNGHQCGDTIFDIEKVWEASIRHGYYSGAGGRVRADQGLLRRRRSTWSKSEVGKVLYLVNKICRQSFQDVYYNQSRKYRVMQQLTKLYKPFVFFKSVFDDTNVENLRMATKGLKTENDDLDFDPTSIDWTDYMMNTHIPGVLKHHKN